MHRFQRGLPRSGLNRRLRLEPLEDRNLLAVDVVGTLIHDEFGNLFTVDIRDNMAVEWLGAADQAFFDIAFSPSGELYGVTGPFSSVSELYRIDVDLANPTPTIETEFIDYVETAPGEWLWLNSLEFRPDGVLFAAGYNESGENFVYTIDPASATATEVITTGQYSSAGDLVFAEDGNMYITTEDPLDPAVFPQLLRVNPALSTVTPLGSITYDDFFGLAYGPGPEAYAFRTQGEVYYVNRDNAALTFVATLTHPQLDGHFIQGAANLYDPPADLGVLDFVYLPDEEPVVGELWYCFYAFRTGYLTAEIVGADPGADIDLKLFTRNSDGTLRQRASGPLRLDYESAAVGQKYFLQIEGAEAAVDVRIANLLQIAGNGAVVHGTSGNDEFEFSRGTFYNFSINGVAYQFGFSPASKVNIAFNGGAGVDSAVLAGSTGVENATLNMETQAADLVAAKYEVHVTGAQNLRFEGGGGADTAKLIGTALKEDLTLQPTAAQLSRTGTLLEVVGVSQITAETRGGDDTVTIQGSNNPALAEQVRAEPQLVEYYATGSFSHRADGFKTLVANSNGGPQDAAFFFDSPGIDHYFADPTQSNLSGPGFDLQANGFYYGLGYSLAGGPDTAEMHGSAGDDVILFYKGVTKLYDEPMTYYRRAKHFAVLDVFPGPANSATDIAYLLDSKAHDEFTGSPDEGTMELNVRTKSSGREVDTTITDAGFDYVHAYSRYGGADVATLHDSPSDDELHAKPEFVKLYNVTDPANLFFVRAKGFSQVDVYADNDGLDRAVFNDSPGADVFTGSRTYSEMRDAASTYVNRVHAFEEVYAFSTPGSGDSAELLDTALKDLLEGNLPKANPLHWAKISSDPALPPDYLYYVYIRGFDSADAYSSNPQDVSTVDPVTADWLITHGW